MNGLSIGDVAKEAEVNTETLRYYERHGLGAKLVDSCSDCDPVESCSILESLNMDGNR